MKALGKLVLTEDVEETFTTVILGKVWTIRKVWNTIGFWTLDIKSSDSSVIVTGIKLVSKAYLLSQYPEFTFDIYIDAEEDPGRETLLNKVVTVYSK